MSEHKPLVLGGAIRLRGDVTTNNWVGARSARALERNLGYGVGRLSGGWAVLLLTQTLVPDDFQFDGITLRSGGRAGLPADTTDEDQKRMRVHDEIMRERKQAGYTSLQAHRLATIPKKGGDRLVKVVPFDCAPSPVVPSRDYPMGGGGLQWKLIRKCLFLVAMTVDRDGIAKIASTPPFSAFLGESATYDDRAKIARYLDQA